MTRNSKITFQKELIRSTRDSKFQDFHNLIRFRVRDILLVSSLYDSYIFEEDGRLYELIRKEYQGLNLSHSPELIQCSRGSEAMELAQEENRFSLIIATLHIDDMPTIEFAKNVRKSGIDTPIILLGYDNREMADLLNNPEVNLFDKVFIWQGDFRIIIGIIKFLEDRKNVEHDTAQVGVQTIILIEDSVRFYSSYLPLIYTELLQQSQSLISEGINLQHKFLRMRARPKILLASTYEEGWDYFEKYQEHVLGIISDIDFKRNGKQDPKAGILFAKNVKAVQSDIPILLQSNNPENEEVAYSIEASFLLKDSPTLLQDLSKFMKEHFSFGDFIFRNLAGEEVGRAHNLLELEDQLRRVPDESIVYHASKNHFSNWLKARTEFWLAHQLRPQKVIDFDSTTDLRQVLINSIKDFRNTRAQGVITDFDKEAFGKTSTFARIGGGSIGGKARGLGFVKNLLSHFDLRGTFEGVNIFVPSLVVVGTAIFDDFLEENNLWDFALRSNDDVELVNRFVSAERFSLEARDQLRDFLSIVKVPIAVRSSSLLEDSQGQPFAGVYDTFIIPNSHHDLEVRLNQLIKVIKRVYASTFYQRSKDYIKVTSYRLEEEKMAIIIQKTIGEEHNGKYYPEISGVAKSYNFYPVKPLESGDGIVSVAMGLGKTIVEGGNTVRFCPRYPHHYLQNSNIEDVLNNSQKKFFAIDMNTYRTAESFNEDDLLMSYDVSTGEEDGTLNLIASTYSPQNEAIYDGTSREGVRVFTMAPILKYDVFPIADVINLILEMGSWGMGAPVELEFAVNLSRYGKRSKQFGLLQMRPLVVNNELEELEIEEPDNEEIICKSEMALGNGVVRDIYDIIMVDRDKFDRSKSNEVVVEISQFNSTLIHEHRRYLLIGVGRWGTLDPWLGIPIAWTHISGAKAIIESNFKDFDVSPSQGTHFFQNLTSFKVGYFTIDDHRELGFLNWDWLKEQPVVGERKYTKHIRFEEPLIIKINGQKGMGVIYKPGIDTKPHNGSS